jgi:PAS domain S-box-containing protein
VTLPRENIHLASILMALILIVAGTTITVLYRTAFDQTRDHLILTASSQASLIEASTQLLKAIVPDISSDELEAATLFEIRRAYQNFDDGPGKTGEIILARRYENSVEFLLIATESEGDSPRFINIDSPLAEPMRLALQGLQGSVIGLDYKGATVLAAYHPVEMLNYGVVVKIDLAEVRAPFIAAALWVFGLAIFLIIGGTFLIFRVNRRLINKIRKSEQRLLDSQRIAHLGTWNWYKKNNYVEWSDEVFRIIGRAPQEFAPKYRDFLAVVHPDDVENARSEFQQSIQERENFVTEYRIINSAGETRYIELQGEMIKGEEGELIGINGTVHDITARKLTEEKLRDSEAHFRAVFDRINIGTIAIDSSGNIRMFNPSAEKIFGYSRNEVKGKNVSMLMAGTDRNQHDSYLSNYLRTGDAQVIGYGRKIFGRRNNGEKIPLMMEIAEMKTGDEPGFVGSFTDLTAMDLLESQLRQLQKTEAIGQLTGGLAHDFNNLLAIIQGNLALLKMDLEEGKDINNEYLESVIDEALEAGERGASLTSRLLSFSRQQVLNPQIHYPNKVVGGIKGLIRTTLREDIDLEWNLEASDWLLKVDASQLENTLLNLSINARDAMPDAGKLIISTSETILDKNFLKSHVGASAGEFVMLSVGDSGIGMDADVLPRVFDPFFTTKGIGRGTGLGLSMAYGFVKQSGGYINIESKPGEGTTIKLYLPRANDEVFEEEGRADAAGRRKGNETILVVEDEAGVRVVIMQMLRRLGYVVLEAADGLAALKALEESAAVDLVICDIVLPGGMRGTEVFESAQHYIPKLKVLYMSGYTDGALLAKGEVDLETNFLAKPFSPADLAIRVREVLDASVAGAG